jgi:hypothetical protein
MDESAGAISWLTELPEVTVGQFSSLLATSVPRGLDPDGPLGALELRDIFRFITVDVYVRYVLFLQARARH